MLIDQSYYLHCQSFKLKQVNAQSNLRLKILTLINIIQPFYAQKWMHSNEFRTQFFLIFITVQWICHCFLLIFGPKNQLSNSTRKQHCSGYKNTYLNILDISSIHAWLNLISVATYHHFYFDSYCTSFSILISSGSQALQNRECVRVTISFMLDLPFLKVMNTDTKKLHLFLLIRNYFSHAMIIQMVNICQLGAIYF